MSQVAAYIYNRKASEMWDGLIGLIQGWWKEKPRKDIVRAVVRLRDTMIECHTWYNQYREALEANDIDSLSPNPNAEWIRSLDDLRLAVSELADVLDIFRPEAREALNDYVIHEYDLAALYSLETYSSGEIGPHERERLMDESFSRALLELRTFISSNFKPEEIFAAQKSKLL